MPLVNFTCPLIPSVYGRCMLVLGRHPVQVHQCLHVHMEARDQLYYHASGVIYYAF